MASAAEPPIGVLDEALDLRIEVGRDGMARIIRLAASTAWEPPTGSAIEPRPADAALPLLDVVLAGEGKAWSGDRYCESEAGGRFRYLGHDRADLPGGWRELRVDLADPVSGLRAEAFYRVLAGQGALRSWVRLTNAGPAPVTVESVTSFLCGGLSSGPGQIGATGVVGATPDDLDDLDVLWAENDWLAEGRWQRRGLRDALPDLNRQVHGADPRGRFGLTSAGTWSSGAYLPMGAVVSRRTGHAWAWQIEHNGGWHWQAGECTHRYRAAGPGPHGRHAPRGRPAAPTWRCSARPTPSTRGRSRCRRAARSRPCPRPSPSARTGSRGRWPP